MSLATLQELMGHKKKETTLKYISVYFDLSGIFFFPSRVASRRVRAEVVNEFR